MPYSERAYFEGDHCAHCGTWEEVNRLARIRTQTIKALDRRNGRR